MSFGKTLRKVWHFLWEEDSLLSWLVNIVLAFILVKFVIYPGLGLVLGTGYPVVAVVSGSMEHDGSFDSWWSSVSNWYEQNGISRQDFEGFDFLNGFDKGDIMLLVGVNPGKVKVGDVIVYSVNSNIPPIIHRVVEIENVNNEFFFTTKGDHNQIADPQPVSQTRVVGKAVFRIPVLGYVKIWFTDFMSAVKGG